MVAVNVDLPELNLITHVYVSVYPTFTYRCLCLRREIMLTVTYMEH